MLDDRLIDALASRGISSLYTHQAVAVERALAGQDTLLVTPTASGKSLGYNLPVLHTLLESLDSRALYLFPTKALAHDQLASLEDLCGSLGMEGAVAAYDGDTPSARRAQIRRSARILLTNPDMLHSGILPSHPMWREVLANLRYVVIDEMHQYRGVFGSHVANVLRRLWRLCRHYGSEPQLIACSATIANPLELAQRLTGRAGTLITENGAPSGERTLVLLNPPIIDATLGIRRSALLEARRLVRGLLAEGVPTIVFARSRLSTELLVTYLREDAAHAGQDPAKIRGYRGGYTPAQRRGIEQGLRRGEVRCVVATNALELGIDIGSLEAAVLVGYPGSIASTWQQIGRAGRGEAPSAAFLIASPSPLDQYIIAHPEFILGSSPEHALLNPDNLHILVNHLQCATYELPFGDDEPYGAEDPTAILAYLEESGLVRHSARGWRWVGSSYPAREISLRTADPTQVLIMEQQEQRAAEAIGWVDRPSAPSLVHEGAIYLHQGQQYLVESLDWERGIASVRAQEGDYYTESMGSTRLDVQRVFSEEERPSARLATGEVLVSSRVTGYRRLRLGTQEHLGWGVVELPEQQLLTNAFWLALDEAVVERLQHEGWWVGTQVVSRGPNWAEQRDRARERDDFRCRWCNAPERPGRQHDVHHLTPFRDYGWVVGQNDNYRAANRLDNLITLCSSCHRLAERSLAVQGTLSGMGRVVANLLPLYCMCDPGDLSVHTELKAQHTGVPTLFVYDRAPGGAGLSESIPAWYHTLLVGAAELVRRCPCTTGCPSCIGPGAGDDLHAKERVLRLLAELEG